MDRLNISVLEYRLSLERNLASTLNRYILISQFFGAVPVNLSIKQSIGPGSIASTRINRLKTWTHYIWSMFIILLICSSIYSRYIRESNKISVANLLDLSEYVFNTGNVIIIMIGCNYQNNCYSQYFNEIIAIDIKLKRCGGKLHPCSLKRFLRIYSMAVSILFILTVINDCLYRQFVFFNIVRGLAVYVLPNIISTLCIMQYFCVLYVLRERFGQIVTILQGFLDEYRSMLGKDYNSKSRVLTVKTLGTNIKSTNVDNDKFFSCLSHKEILNSLRGIFHELTVIYLNINRSFGIFIVSLATSAFVIICQELYTFYRLAETSDNLNVYEAIYSVLWVTLHYGRVFGILYRNSMVDREVYVLFNFLLSMRIVSFYSPQLIYLYNPLSLLPYIPTYLPILRPSVPEIWDTCMQIVFNICNDISFTLSEKQNSTNSISDGLVRKN